MAARAVPFGLFLCFILIAQLFEWFGRAYGWDPSSVGRFEVWLYPLKTVVVGAALAYYWPQYDELGWPPRFSGQSILVTVGAGFLVYLAWVRMDWPWAMQGGQSAGYRPFGVPGSSGAFLAIVRLMGAAIVVPVMEELFWRSFLMRYLISSRFEVVRLGTFTPLSFICVVLLFGVEHDLWLAGMMAGVVYGLLLLWSRNLWVCVGAHAVTNFSLGIHVLVTNEWYWW